MQLQTARLSLRFLTQSDWQSLQAIWEDFSRSPYAQYDIPHPTQEDILRDKLVRWEAASLKGDALFFAVCLQGRVIGYIDFHRCGDGFDSGYCFHSAYQGYGYAKESYRALAQRLKAQGAARLTAGTALANLPSVRLLRSLGFRQTAQERVSFYKDAQGNDIFFDGGRFELRLK